jgi:hypothetical protein
MKFTILLRASIASVILFSFSNHFFAQDGEFKLKEVVQKFFHANKYILSSTDVIESVNITSEFYNLQKLKFNIIIWHISCMHLYK